MRLLAFLFVALMTPGWTQGLFAQATVETYEVVARGYGAGEQEAVKDALYNAIRQVSGERIASSTKLRMTSSKENGRRDYRQQQDYEASAETRGLVSSYRVETLGVESATGRAMVSIRARVPLYVPDAQSKRLKLAVLPVSLAPTLQSMPEALQLAADMHGSLESALVSTQRFAVLDRNQSEGRDQELARLSSQDVPLSETIRLGQSLVAQYLTTTEMTGVTFTPGRRTTSSGRNVDYLTVQFKIDMRVIDVDTGQIKVAHSISRQHTIFPPNGPSALARASGEELAELITAAIYPMAVIAIQTGGVTLNQGGLLVKPKQRFALSGAGAYLDDPVSLRNSPVDVNEIAVVEITSVTDRFAQARLISGTLPLQAPPNSLIARRIPRTQADAIADFSSAIDAARDGGKSTSGALGSDW